MTSATVLGPAGCLCCDFNTLSNAQGHLTLTRSLCQWQESGWNWRQKYQTYHEPVFFCSSLVKSRPTRLHPEAMYLKQKYLFYINIDKTTNWGLQRETSAHFLVSDQPVPLLQFPRRLTCFTVPHNFRSIPYRSPQCCLLVVVFNGSWKYVF